ncbi:MAG: AmmeMemoRadiSam system protein B [Bacteroidota bacterium]
MALDLRPSPIAGTWYESDPAALAESVDHYLSRAVLPDLQGDVMGVIAPHAGHIYSGPVAGYAFAALQGRECDLAVVISPYHDYHDSPLLTSAHEAYATPLGSLPIDRETLGILDAELKKSLGFGLTSIARDHEHSLEIELPFLQRTLAGAFKLLPLMVRAQAPNVSQSLGHALASVLRGRRFVLVGSTDLSHFYPQKVAQALDQEMLRHLQSFSPEGMFAAEFAGKAFACGLGAVTAVLWAAADLGADRVVVLDHATSGDVTGDFASVVGYGAAAILKSRGK